MYYYSIIPFVRLPRGLSETFTYTSSEQIDPGAFVRVSFRNQIVRGLVICTTQKPTFHLLPVTTILRVKLPISLVHFYARLPNEMFEHLGSILTTIFRKLSIEVVSAYANERTESNKMVQTAVPLFRRYTSRKERLTFLSKEIARAQKNVSSLLIMIPGLADAMRVYAELRVLHPSIIFYSGSTALKPRSNSYPPIVLSTRVGIFLPICFSNLICDDEPNPLYRHLEPSPTYDARRIAEIRSSIIGSKLIYSGYSLRDRDKNKKSSTPSIQAMWIDLKNQPKHRDSAFFSNEALALIRENNALIIASGKDYARRGECRGCRFVFTCVDCESPYVLLNQHDLLCFRCGKKDSMPPFCPSCQTTEFFYPGAGARQLAGHLEKIGIASGMFTSRSLTQIDDSSLDSFSHIIIVLADALLGSSYESIEALYHSLVKICGQSRNQVVIQYYSEVLRSQLTHIHAALKKERSIKKNLGLPPWGDLYTVRYYPKTKKGLLESEALAIVAKLFTIPPERIISVARKKRGLSFITFDVKVKKDALINWKQLPQEFHIVKY